MSVSLDCKSFPLSAEEVQELFHASCRHAGMHIGEITVRCVSEQEIQQLNHTYRGKGKPTNILTFSYSVDTHDIAISLDVAMMEASQYSVPIKDYCALLLVHAFLHASGMDHEASHDEDEKTRTLERSILAERGFISQALSEVYL